MRGKKKWTIHVGGYGTFEFFGTEAEAETMRRHKANWENSVGKKHESSVTCRICDAKKDCQ